MFEDYCKMAAKKVSIFTFIIVLVETPQCLITLLQGSKKFVYSFGNL